MSGLVILLPALACGLSLALGARTMSYLQIGIAGLVSTVAMYLVATPGAVRFFWDGFFVLDPLNTVILVTISVLEFLISLYSFGYVRTELKHGASAKNFRFYFFWKNLFILSMMVSVLANHLGIYWIGLEATTLTTVLLVAFYRNRESYEAAWKYIITCSTGIAIGLFALVILYFSTAGLLGDSLKALSFYDILANAGRLDRNLLMLAFILALVGFGTKAGLAPMHSWLPDAHSHAPGPVSSLLSGVLLNIALLGILRLYQLNLAAGNTSAGRFLIVFGLLTLIVSSLAIIRQKEYKRLFAYSSMEHMGLITLGIGFGGVSVFGALLHVLFHAINKGVLFLASGNILAALHTRKIRAVRGLLTSMPVTAAVLLLGAAGISGIPPFSIFLSKFYLLLGVFRVSPWAGIGILLLIGLIFAGMIHQLLSMLLGKAEKNVEREIHGAMVAVPLVMLLISTVMLFYLPAPFMRVLGRAVHELGGLLP